MTSIELAEVLLSLVMPQEHAAAAVGDFAESSNSRAAFWGNVLRTTAATIGETIAANPRWAAGTVARIALKNLTLHASLTIGVIVIALVSVMLSRVPGMSWIGWLPAVVEAVGRIWIAFLLGQWITNRERDRSLAALTAYTLLMLALAALSWSADLSFVAPSHIRLYVWQVLFPLPGVLFSGLAVLVGRRSARGTHA